ncbi:unnamed protein product [Vitrella brassicaformis CCMP3155]|uniref:Uncharacterized protein n=1 Tax=Vitrella brassicaformis (strain CCMP3155) TaxID=1169540 RepID=A0A0G4H8H0_VITBC|nr:unnamed protein product [Vitrella brassicaformis CCMP3155]|eukprot:CEM40060.1 unnamed protein product [Vitrella brassicaformis CCMP3155]
MAGNRKFVGWTTVQIVDSDGLEKRVKGMAMTAPIHIKESGGMVTLTSDFPRADPIRLVHLTGSDDDYVTARWQAGHVDSKGSGHNRLICALKTISAKKSFDEQAKDDCHVFVGEAHVPFCANGYDCPVKVKFTTSEFKLVTRIVKVEAEIPATMWKEWSEYHEALKEWEKEMKDDHKD